jgi:hypothetical protein
MVQNTAATELGKALGSALYNTQLYKDDFIDTEEVTNIDLYMGESIVITGTYIVSSRALPGSAFILDHPVYCNLDSSTLNLDGNYAVSSSLVSSGNL